jgi:hypothetical protein
LNLELNNVIRRHAEEEDGGGVVVESSEREAAGLVVVVEGGGVDGVEGPDEAEDAEQDPPQQVVAET